MKKGSVAEAPSETVAPGIGPRPESPQLDTAILRLWNTTFQTDLAQLPIAVTTLQDNWLTELRVCLDLQHEASSLAEALAMARPLPPTST